LERGCDDIFDGRNAGLIEEHETIQWLFHPRDYKAVLFLARAAIFDGKANGYTCRPVLRGGPADWVSIMATPYTPEAAKLIFRWQDGQKYLRFGMDGRALLPHPSVK